MITREKRNSNATQLLIVALLSGMLCYRIGMFAGCSSSWLQSMESMHSLSLAPMNEGANDDPDDPAFYGAARSNTTAAAAAAATRTKTTFEPNDRRTVPRPDHPYDCGVVFFYHIPSTGGASINQWFRKYQKPAMGNISYYQHWELAVRPKGFHADPKGCEAKFNAGMEKHIQNLGPKEWRIAHSHVTSTYMNESEHLLYKWRADVEAQGCEMINTIMLRDPLNHAMSLHKIVKSKNSTQEEWPKYLNEPTGTGLWGTVLDFFLYNIHGNRNGTDYHNGVGGRNPYNVTKEEKVARALELLHRHFDIVTVADHAMFQSTLLNWTGWRNIKMPHGNVYKKDLHFTKKEVETLQKLLHKNGDLDFVDQVKYEYHDHLSYLHN
mmetsp:Transcript_25841/g.54613  ORF Transcript_25841/g.54613 Transcript_25841/m.54613 type:complete len:380 (+) Transcript_25841:240-1379(+)|eukprot:CAMPEP_0183733452 /NCGR_PEP_ID=MMETSP0737-20130205/41242_1 /TAXON_ID=385413 /ORGANISM="Thalassiosira miniscula, Strain CCMP1093" /LENGTH=379 /DNA_ID=CAMNT_0025966707 /DNA_START=155 /DNA_END=1294 /DNA_ORIENTATION=+